MDQPTLTDQNKVTFDPFSGPAIESVLYTTKSQSEIWIACKLGGIDANRAYNMLFTLILNGSLNKSAILKAIQSLVHRNEALRSVFSTDGRYMTIFKHLPIEVDQHDLSELSDSEKESALKDYLSANANDAFDLVRGPLIKFGLIKVSQTEHQLILTAHHIICDGWSVGVILQELGRLYSANVLNTDRHVLKPESFIDYAEEQQAYLVSEAHKINEEYWLNQYKDVPQLTLPTDFPRPSLRTYKGHRLYMAMTGDLAGALKKTGIKAGCSFVTTLLSAFEIFLYAQTGQDTIVIGLPSADQAASGKNQLIGHCVNVLPLRSKIDIKTNFSDYLKQRKSQFFDAYDHQKLSFGELLQKLPIARDPSRIPLVPVMFNIDMGMDDAVSFSGLTHKLISNPRAYEAFELFLDVTESGEELILEWIYNTKLFRPETIEQMMVSFEEILNRIVENPNDSISNIVKADYFAYQELNTTKAPYPDFPIHELLAKQAQKSSKKVAIKFGEIAVSYKHLEEQVHQLAHQLIEQGIKPGDFIGVSLPRSIELVMVLNAILECGAAYVPLDPNYPSKRLEFMLKDSEAPFLITSKAASFSLESDSSLCMVEDLFLNLSGYTKTPVNLNVDPNEVAYLLYTSGSTGNPKGVPITHKSLVNFLFSMSFEPGIKESDTLLSITTISFDIAGLELFLPLLTGATLVIADDETAKDTRLMLDLLKKEDITILQATPSTWQMLIDAGWNEPLSLKAICGGEALPMALANKIVKQVDELWNVYGPTETTIWSAIKQIKEGDGLITIGRPIANTQFYILNQQGLLLPPGTIGEICIAGDGLAKEYWKRPDLTAEKFMLNSFHPESSPTLYRTGDLGKLLSNGEVQCLGRIDQQVKIRGHRIELGEIEKALDDIKEVQASVVLVYANRLIANLVLDETDAIPNETLNKWKQVLAEKLPSHMVPQEFNVLSAFPKTLNGKIDRKALLASLSSKTKPATYTPPRNKTEKIVATIWQECLAIDAIDIYSDFFELGGHSLIAVKVMALIEKQTNNRLPLSALFEYSSIEKLAMFMDMEDQSDHWNSLVPIKPNGSKTPLYIVHGGEFNVLGFNGLAKSLDDDQPVYGLQAKGLNSSDEPHATVEEMVNGYVSEIINANPHGPYALAGYSLGGIIAFEMARELKAQGKNVISVVLFDTYVYPYFYYADNFRKNAAVYIYAVTQDVSKTIRMLKREKSFKRGMDLIKSRFFKQYLEKTEEKEKQHQILNKWPLKLDRMHRIAMSQYHILPQDIEIDLLRVIEDGVFYAHDTKYLGWKKIALKGVRRHMVPGNHLNMLDHPHVEKLATVLQGVLDTNAEKHTK